VAHGRDDIVGIVGNEDVRRAQRQLLQRVPDPVVLPGLGEMVARGAARRALGGDDRLELLSGAIDDAEVAERPGEYHDAGAITQRAGQLGLDLPPRLRAGDLLPQAPAVIDEHAALDRVGVRVVSEIRLLTQHFDEVGQPAVILGQVARRWAGALRHLLAPRRWNCGPSPA
jgi:hypothetical protein